MSYLINLFWIALSVILVVTLMLLAALFVVLIVYIQVKEAQRDTQPVAKLTFDGPSRMEMQRTTARLMKQDQSGRKYRRPYFNKTVA